MSYIYLQEQGEESSVESYQNIPQYVLSRLNLTQERCCSNDSETESCHISQSGTISEPSMEHHGVEKLTLLPEDFLVKTFPQQERELASRAREADSGERWPGWLAKYDQGLSLWKTPQCSLLEDYIEFSETWPKWGIMHDGAFWELTMSVRHIEESGYGYLPTPTSTDATAGAVLNKNTKLIRLSSGKLRKISNNGVSGSIGLARTVALWPTPDANMGARGTQPEWKPIRQSGQPAQYTINQAVRDKQKWPTPQARDWKGSSGRSLKGLEIDLPTAIKKWPTPTACMSKGSSENALTRKDGRSRENDRLDHKVFVLGGQSIQRTYPTPTASEYKRRGPNSKQQGLSTIEPPANGQLNPDWVEWLMGWPIGWTALKPLEMDRFHLWLLLHGLS